jgi:hypothetical protein
MHFFCTNRGSNKIFQWTILDKWASKNVKYTDALSRKAQCNCVSIDSKIATLCDELCKLNIEVVSWGALSYISVEPTLHEQIVMAQIGDKGVQVIKEMIRQKVDKYKCFRQNSKGILWFGDRLVVPKNPELRKKILDEAHFLKLSMHPGSNKMYHDLRSLYLWTRMKREIAKYISKCDTCQRVKASHLKVAGTLHPLPIPRFLALGASLRHVESLSRVRRGWEGLSWPVYGGGCSSGRWHAVCRANAGDPALRRGRERAGAYGWSLG